MEYENIKVEPRDGLEILTLNRPGSLNALSSSMVDELADYYDGLERRRDVRVVVMRGAGRAFCAGLDIKETREDDGSEGRIARSWRIQTSICAIMRRMRAIPQPIVTLGHGAACGGGFSLLLASDVRIGAPDLRMNAAYIKIGLGGADMGSSYLLPRLVGASLAAELLLTGRFIDAERALQRGLLSDVVEQDKLLDAGLSMAEEMLSNSPFGLALTKQALVMNIDAQSMDAAVALEDRQQVMLAQMDDHGEAMTAFVEKRAPRYTGR